MQAGSKTYGLDLRKNPKFYAASLGGYTVKLKSIAVCATVVIAGCATNPNEIAPTYVSPVLYQNLNCNQLREEAQAVSYRAAQAAGVQKSNAGKDAAMTGIGLVLFWPSLFFIKGDGAQAAELARLKGEMQAIEQVNRQKGCGITFQG